jgi:hypothetical protein
MAKCLNVSESRPSASTFNEEHRMGARYANCVSEHRESDRLARSGLPVQQQGSFN